MAKTETSTDKLIGVKELSDYIGIPERTLREWNYKGIGPKSYRVGRWLKYRKSEVDEWLETQSRNR
jgi:excisionase family DNA binding protein